MSRIKVINKDFPNIMVAYLLDMMLHRDEESGNEMFDELLNDFGNKGMFPIFLKYYRNMDPTERRKYKFIKQAVSPFEGTTENATIQILPEKEKQEE